MLPGKSPGPVLAPCEPKATTETLLAAFSFPGVIPVVGGDGEGRTSACASLQVGRGRKVGQARIFLPMRLEQAWYLGGRLFNEKLLYLLEREAT